MNRLTTRIAIALAMMFPIVAGAATDKGTQTMEGRLRKAIAAHGEMRASVQAFVAKNLLPMITDAVLVKAVEAQNAKQTPLSEIQAIDKKWVAAEEELPLQKELLNNACAKALAQVSGKFPAVKETFVMDDQGANVCMNSLTSDYWQGDEAKWQNSFAGRQGGVDAGKARFDKSANATLQQVSLPILGKGGKVIGAITFGLAVDQI